jgi:hypothetical protein
VAYLGTLRADGSPRVNPVTPIVGEQLFLFMEPTSLKGLLPVLEIHGPNGETSVVDLAKDHVSIGRFRELNDIGLEPDPQQLVTRKTHCILEHEGDTRWLIDNGSVNRTFVRRDSSVEVVNGRVTIQDGDAIRILGLLTEDGQPLYWELIFSDPLKTNRVVEGQTTIHLEYD